MKDMIPDKLLNEREVALQIGCSPSKLRQDRCRGLGLPYVKFGRLVKYASSDVQAYLDTHKITPNALGNLKMEKETKNGKTS